MIKHVLYKGYYTKLTPREIYRINRIRIARDLHINPSDVDAWSLQDYHDYLEVTAADRELDKIN